MKRVSLLAALVGVLTLTAWLGSARPAAAIPSCNELDGGICTQGSSVSCRWYGGAFGFCGCPNDTWICS